MPPFAQITVSSGPPPEWGASLVRMMGAFHPLVVHFPIALLLTAAFLEVVSVWIKDQPGLRLAIAVNLVLGTLGAVIAATLGWMDAAHMGFEPDLKPVLAWHRWLGTSVAIGSVITTGLWFQAARAGAGAGLWMYRTTLWCLALLICVTGHLGALLVYGLDYFSF